MSKFLMTMLGYSADQLHKLRVNELLSLIIFIL